MKWWTRFIERRAQTWALSRLQRWSEMGIGGGPTVAGVDVTPEKALSVPSVFACVSVISQDVAKTPIKLRQRVAEDTFEDALSHPLYELLNSLPNPETTAFSFKQTMMLDLLAHQRAYAEIVRVDGQIVALWRLDPEAVIVDRDEQRRKRYRVTLPNGQPQTWLFDASQPPIFELTHPSPIQHCRDLIGTALALQTYVGKFFAHGARLNGILQADHLLEEDAKASLSRSFAEWFAGPQNAFKTAVLEQGVKFVPLAAPNDDAQLNETMMTIAVQIAGTFRVPPWKIGDLTKTSYSNMEAGAIEYATSTLDPYLNCWEHALRRDVLTSRQYGRYDVLFDRSTLIRADVKSLHEALARGRDAGYYSVNDVRRKLGENPIGPEGDVYEANANLKPIGEGAAS